MGLHMSVSRYVSKSSGYAFIKVKGKWVTEHRVVMEEFLGRKLTRYEIPHHIDESFEGRSNNDIDNLQLMTRANHQKHHGKDRRHSYFISFNKRYNRYQLFIRNGDEFKSFGYYDTEEYAINAFKTGIRINRHDERQSREYRIWFYSARNKWRLLIKQKERRSGGQRIEKNFGEYNTKEEAEQAFESRIKIDRRLKHVASYVC
jgi:hypothetical protein